MSVSRRSLLQLGLAVPWMAEPARAQGLLLLGVGGRGGGVAAASAFTTWNPADLAFITLSNGNLTATTTNSAGPGVRAVKGYSAGKFYWEATMATWVGNGAEIGLSTLAAALGGGGLAGQAVATKALGGINGSIYINGVDTGSALGVRASGDVIGTAVDLGAGLIWFHAAPVGNWNGSGTANPATGVGGLSLGAMAGAVLYPVFGALSVS